MATGFTERRWTSRDGLSLYARDYAGAGGEARLPVICLHGLTRNSKDFEGVAPIIAGLGRRVIVPDVRGRGQSDRDPSPANYRPPIYARDVVEMMAALHAPRAVFLGTSMGGLITMTLAALRPNAIAAAILNDVGPAIAPEGVARILGYAGKPVEIRSWDDAADYVRQAYAPSFPAYDAEQWRDLTRRTFRDKNGVPVLDYDPAISAALRKPPGRAARWIAAFLFRRLARGRPLLLIRGELSDLITADLAARMKRTAPHAQSCVVPGVGHAPALTEPAAIDAIAQFLRTVP
ncbi:alpha/beta hydrolase [Sphingomonas sp.]|uniref:alpha/beta fold hydrolase n=1 Tax=Sphingomonas sp. TaxID=28214 RepID=UPI00286E767C|nr:alpha/beta hydrolase [Sphingomonas sp.]